VVETEAFAPFWRRTSSPITQSVWARQEWRRCSAGARLPRQLPNADYPEPAQRAKAKQQIFKFALRKFSCKATMIDITNATQSASTRKEIARIWIGCFTPSQQAKSMA